MDPHPSGDYDPSSSYMQNLQDATNSHSSFYSSPSVGSTSSLAESFDGSINLSHHEHPSAMRNSSSSSSSVHSIERERSRSGPGPSSTSQGFGCPNCGKVFAREDLLRRHLAREARALAQPSFDRQKSCYECARSKARCDLEVPSCGRCRSRGKQCAYAPRSGNPNVRKARNNGMFVPSRPSMPYDPSMQNSSLSHNDSFGNQQSPWSTSTPGYDGGENPRLAEAGGQKLVKHEGEDYESDDAGRSWSDSYGNFRLERTPSTSSASTGSGYASPRSSFSVVESASTPSGQSFFPVSPAFNQAFAPPVRTESPASFGREARARIDPNGTGRKSSGFGRTNTGSIVTQIDRSGDGYNNEEGEETPIGRAVASSFTNQPGLDVGMTASGACGNPSMIPGLVARMRNGNVSQHSGPSNMMSDSVMPDGWGSAGDPTPQAHPAPSPNVGSMGSSFVPPRSASLGSQPSMFPPQTPSLTPAHLITNVQPTRLQIPNPSPIRTTLFTGSLDLSGWLDEPVVPSPLYRMGPSLHSLGSAMAGMGFHQSPSVEQHQQQQPSSRLAAPPVMTSGNSSSSEFEPLPNRSRSDPTGQDKVRYGADGELVEPAPRLPSAKIWWSSPQQEGSVKESLAQASAAHFVSYPALMVLTDPTSPIPPFIHRRWLHEVRFEMPSTLANARAILAGYFVRLPASEALVWRLISDQIRSINDNHAQLCNEGSDSFEVFAAVTALWMYLVLVIFTDDAASAKHVDGSLLESSFDALSDLTRTLVKHHDKLERERGGQATNQPTGGDFGNWGCSETLRRTVFAAYSLLVLQRFRAGAAERSDRLAGCQLVLDLRLPSVADEFEAGNEEEWRSSLNRSAVEEKSWRGPQQRRQEQQQSTNSDTATTTAAQASGASLTPQGPTLRQVIEARRNGPAAPPPRWLQSYFDNHDDFTNVVLSVALALDSGIQ
ncbi:hypothetical protein IE53DRAFT_14225 [Violaceomyces palustris]|uniref:Uncharacterized protein n=1 Tax=Violaceomyces palustris TaxID=1673888 RepID=A0ACD0NLH4_9BASI|nr:hypothetical protein IE53DRAFT_14225 [Violaceomyces palustris]